jgi:hypothetical protein
MVNDKKVSKTFPINPNMDKILPAGIFISLKLIVLTLFMDCRYFIGEQHRDCLLGKGPESSHQTATSIHLQR